MSMKLIIDTDPGIDDAMAYFYAHACENMDVLALTTIFGNVTIGDGTHNALWLIEFSNANTEVYQGCREPLEIKPNGPSDYVHGKHGFGNRDLQPISRTKAKMTAAEFLVKTAQDNIGEITVCAIGPLTNIAKALELDPDFVSNLNQLVIMGGSLDAGGNVTDFAEANFWNDPHAADIVLNAPHRDGGGDIVIVGLDVTNKIFFTPHDFEQVKKVSPITGGFLDEIGDFYMKFYQSRSGKYQCSLHDPAAVIACELPELFVVNAERLAVICEGAEIGQMVRREDTKGRLCYVCVNAQSDSIVAQYKKIVGLNP